MPTGRTKSLPQTGSAGAIQLVAQWRCVAGIGGGSACAQESAAAAARAPARAARVMYLFMQAIHSSGGAANFLHSESDGKTAKWKSRYSELE